MTRPVSGTTGTEIAKAITRPILLIELGFSSTLRYSSAGALTWNSLSWSSGAFRLSMPGSGSWSVDLFNATYAVGQTVLAQGTAGKTARVYQLYGAGPYADADGEQLFEGEMGEAVISGTTVRIALKKRPPQRTPRLLATPPVFNFLPAPGTVVRTAAGETVLETKSRNRAGYRRPMIRVG